MAEKSDIAEVSGPTPPKIDAARDETGYKNNRPLIGPGVVSRFTRANGTVGRLSNKPIC